MKPEIDVARAIRTWDKSKANFVQTLEPRAYYVYVPFKDQTKAPVFDTAIDSTGSRAVRLDEL